MKKKAEEKPQKSSIRTILRPVMSSANMIAVRFSVLLKTRKARGSTRLRSCGMVAPLIRIRAPLLSRREVGGSPIGDALGGAANFLENFDPFADAKREQSYRLVESQIASLNAGTLSRAPGSAARTARRSYGASDFEARPSGKAAALGKPSKWQVGDVNVTNPLPWGIEVNPDAADGSSFEDRWGEIGGSIAGLGVFAADVWHLAKLFAPWARKRARDVQKRAMPRSGGGGW